MLGYEAQQQLTEEERRRLATGAGPYGVQQPPPPPQPPNVQGMAGASLSGGPYGVPEQVEQPRQGQTEGLSVNDPYGIGSPPEMPKFDPIPAEPARPWQSPGHGLLSNIMNSVQSGKYSGRLDEYNRAMAKRRSQESEYALLRQAYIDRRQSAEDRSQIDERKARIKKFETPTPDNSRTPYEDMARRHPDMEPDEIERRLYAARPERPQKPDKPSFDEQAYDEWKQSNPKGTRLEFKKELSSAGRADPKVDEPKPLAITESVWKEADEKSAASLGDDDPSNDVSRDQAVDGIMAGRRQAAARNGPVRPAAGGMGELRQFEQGSSAPPDGADEQVHVEPVGVVKKMKDGTRWKKGPKGWARVK